MNVELLNYGKYYPLAVDSYCQNQYAFKSVGYNHNLPDFFKSFYRNALKTYGGMFVDKNMVALAIQKCYQNSTVKYQPYQVVRTAIDIANQHNMVISARIKAGFSLPDFSDLTDMIDFFGGILKKIVQAGMIGGIAIGIVVIIGAILGAPTYAFVGTPSAAAIVAMKAAETAMNLKILAGVAIALSSLFTGTVGVVVTEKMWDLMKRLMEVFGILDKNRVVRGLIGNTDTYKKFEEAIDLIDQYKYNEKIPKKVSHKIEILLIEAGIKTDNFLKDLMKLKSIHKKAADTILQRQKEEEKKKKSYGY